MSVAATPALRLHVHSWRPGIGTLGALVIGCYGVVAVVAGFVAPYRTTEAAGMPLTAPSWQHLLGTNGVGQDVFSQVLSGTRVSLFIAVVAGGGAVALGTVLGSLSGWFGGRTDAMTMRAVDVALVIPSLPLMIVLASYVGTSVGAIAAVIAFTAWPGPARVLRSQVLSLRNRAHLRASVGFGAGALFVLRRHILPDLSPLIAAAFVGSASRAVMMEAGLAFLGVGDPTRASWGSVMRDALNFHGLFDTSAWTWWLMPPMVAILVLLLGLTFIGISLEKRANPRLSRHRAGRNGG